MRHCKDCNTYKHEFMGTQCVDCWDKSVKPDNIERIEMIFEDISEHNKRHYYKSRYGVNFDHIFEQQNRACAACNETNPLNNIGLPAERPWHMDHDSKTGKVGGILCYRCNLAKGYIQDSPQRLRMLANWIERTYFGKSE